jgi:TP901 family phage tail tape measure protein
MAETAVVTDFSVGDMWDALPKYTKAANELGTTTLGAYETMTLFYQQGLDTNEVFEVGTETMKMARIAGLDYAEATNLMTAALRGFNMELNETSAKRVNDVYSELAAITAADTEEIATAMTKTASIAKSANMEFETTAAFLSQIIETTREPAETAGTAMKTIIARFTEMKKASSDVINFEGEEINVNKVEEALRSAGVALRDVNGEFRDTDDVFLELASKWDNLDIMTQRYIATMAAGSRQQSRFLAMMQDYDRTIELIDAAYNSSGASAAQFAKTQETLESKLNKLKNAWDEFLMGIADSKLVKGFIDILTQLLNVINKLTGNSGLAKLTVAMGTLLGGKIISDKIFGNVENSIVTKLLKPLNKVTPVINNIKDKLSGLGTGSWWS